MSAQQNRGLFKREAGATNKLTVALFITYLIVLYWILLFKLGVRFSYMGNRQSVNLVPFGAPAVSNGSTNFSEMLLNVVVFVPLGIYTGILFERWAFGKKLFFFFLISLSCEVLQFALKLGASDITDVLTNTLGGLFGLMMFKAVEKLFNNRRQARNFVTAVATIGTALTILFLAMLKMNMLPIRYQ